MMTLLDSETLCAATLILSAVLIVDLVGGGIFVNNSTLIHYNLVLFAPINWNRHVVYSHSYV